MGTLKALTLTASIENEADIREWIASVQAACEEAQKAITAVVDQMAKAPHIAIHLEQTGGDK